MSRNKKPVIVVAALLGGLILLPVLIWSVSRLGGSDGPLTPTPSETGSAGSSRDLPDFDLSRLAEKADQLLSQDIAEALREGDVSLDFVAGLNKEAERARGDLRSGRTDRAKERFLAVVSAAESQLEAIAAADRARELKGSTYTELQRLEYLRVAFENTYREAVDSYNDALRSLEAGRYLEAVDQFELAGAILGDLEARAIQQLSGLLEAGQAALEKYELTEAKNAFRSVLEIDSANAAATEGLTMVSALEGIAESIKAIRTLESEGKLNEALAALDRLAADHPNNPFIKNQRTSLEKRIANSEFDRLVARSLESEAAGNYGEAIADLEEALKIKTDTTQQERLEKLQATYKAARLEMLLADGFQALKGARYEAARNLYKEAVALDPESKEARTGLEKASSLYLASIRYNQNIASAERSIKEGRFPLAARFFNEAMSSRPDNLMNSKLKKEEAIRSELEKQSKEVPVTVISDGRTFVSIIGVLPPDRFKDRDLKLFPDVYKIKGTRKGYKDVEMDLKVDASRPNQSIRVQCIEKI